MRYGSDPSECKASAPYLSIRNDSLKKDSHFYNKKDPINNLHLVHLKLYVSGCFQNFKIRNT